MRVTAKPVGVSRAPDGTEVDVVVIGPSSIPDEMKELRARAQALIEVGPKSVATSTASKVRAGQIDRLTTVESEREENDPEIVKSYLPSWIKVPDFASTEAVRYTIKVKEE
jgi:hypothetical protein